VDKAAARAESAAPRLEPAELARIAPGRPVVIIEEAREAAGAQESRDANLARLVEVLADGGTLIVLNIPREGEGSLVARGPALREGRVLAGPRPWRMAAALLAHALGRRVEGPDGGAAASWLEGGLR
jgi:hypothetical protein